MNSHNVAYCAYKAGAAEHVLFHHFLLLPSYHLLLLCCIVLALPSMATDSIINLLLTNPSLDDDAGDESEAESTAMTNSSSPTRDAVLMAKGGIPKLMDFFKGTTVSEEEL
jgi:hypothetical protein